MLGIAILMIIAILLALFVSLSNRQKTTRTIRVRQDFSTIQEAINDANFGDMIRVSAGTYFEHVIVNKTVALVGENSSNTIIDGNNTGTVVQILADNVIISGFRLQNSGYGWTREGVYVYAANNVKISSNTFVNACHDIKLNYSQNSEVLGNTINGTMYGIRLMNSINCTAIGNNVSNCVAGVHLENATDCIVRGNYFTQNDQGIRFYSPCADNAIIANTVWNNNYDGMIAVMPPNATFFNNTVFHNNFVNNSEPFIIQSNGTVWDNGLEGNYWTSYEGTDADQNGVGDTPYTFSSNEDSFPLTGNSSEFTIQTEAKEYTVTAISNSNMSEFSFESTSNGSRIDFDVYTENESLGFCRITIPADLMNYPFTVWVDNDAGHNATLKTLQGTDDSKQILLYFTYPSGIHKITVTCGSTRSWLLEFLLPILLISTAIIVFLAVIVLRKLGKKNVNKS